MKRLLSIILGVLALSLSVTSIASAAYSTTAYLSTSELEDRGAQMTIIDRVKVTAKNTGSSVDLVGSAKHSSFFWDKAFAVTIAKPGSTSVKYQTVDHSSYYPFAEASFYSGTSVRGRTSGSTTITNG